MTTATVPVRHDDPTNAAILAVSEDRIAGFREDPFGAIADGAGVDIDTVLARLRALLASGTIRRIRQTLLATNLAPGALVAWEVSPERLNAAFDAMFQDDPFSGHVVIRSTDGDTPGSRYRLWTTLKVPQGYSLDRHAAHLAGRVGATAYRIMPAKRLFTLGVGHTRRRLLEPGARSAEAGPIITPAVVTLSPRQWQALTALKRDLALDEVRRDIWALRAAEAGMTLDEFCAIGRELQALGVIGRFSTFLEHVKELATGERVTRYNALFHWVVPPGKEIAAGQEVARHEIITHAYWREAGPEFANVNLMAVAHGMEKDRVLAHKAAIDAHLTEAGIPTSYTNVFWGGRSEIKPSEISPLAYAEWCRANGLDPESMREEN